MQLTCAGKYIYLHGIYAVSTAAHRAALRRGDVAGDAEVSEDADVVLQRPGVGDVHVGVAPVGETCGGQRKIFFICTYKID